MVRLAVALDEALCVLVTLGDPVEVGVSDVLGVPVTLDDCVSVPVTELVSVTDALSVWLEL